jgi:hypothetical protein
MWRGQLDELKITGRGNYSRHPANIELNITTSINNPRPNLLFPALPLLIHLAPQEWPLAQLLAPPSPTAANGPCRSPQAEYGNFKDLELTTIID